MPFAISHWERRDSTDRVALANAALDVCRANKAVEGSRGCRFYWGGDAVVLVWEAEDTRVFDTPLSPERARANFTLTDLARNVGSERWMEPRVGEESYRLAGRL
jgi:hypothetical protein